MENYSVWADLLHTFRMMSDEAKVLVVYMPCVFSLGLTALYMHHLRHYIKAQPKPPTPYTILPPEKTVRHEPLHPALETLQKLDEFVVQERSQGDGRRG